MSAIVRDRKGRFVQNLSATDFEVLDGGQPRAITDFRRDLGGVSVALLFDISGSMEAMLASAREAATHVLSWLDEAQDEAAIFTFDTRLSEVAPFTTGLRRCPTRWRRPCRSARPRSTTRSPRLPNASAEREGRRRAVVVFTDGNDNASRLTPSEVSAIASGIDVPVYIFGIVPSIDNPSAEQATSSVDHSPFAGPLADLATWTGGRVFVVSAPVAAQRRGAADRRRAAASVSHRIRIERQAGLASARGPRTQQGPHRSRPEWIHRGAISPEFA